MTKGKKITISIFATIAASIFIFFSVVGVLHFINRKNVKYDTVKGAVASQKVESAQYVPDVEKFIEANSGASVVSGYADSNTDESNGDTKTISTLEDFNEIVDKYATVDNYAGAGKYLGYDIYEIKDEIKFVVDHVPVFGQWFRMPTMREKQGYISIPYYENWAYYLELDEETNALSITRVCYATRTSYLDFENQKTIEYYDDGSSIIQYEVMKTNYFFDEEGNEVVECYLYSVAVDHVDGKYADTASEFMTGKPGHSCNFNPNTSDYHSLEFQYLKNVKDKMLVKYHITTSERYRDDESFDEGGQDLRGLTPYGIRREFMVVNYDGYTNIETTEIDQNFATLNHPEYDGAVDFDVTSNNIKLLTEQLGMKQSDVENLDSKQLLESVARHIIDNFEIKNNWPSIYENSDLSYSIKTIKGPFYGQNILITDFYSYVSARDHDQNILEFDADADIYDYSAFDKNKEYSLSLALKSRETGELTIIATSYAKLYGSEDTSYNLARTILNVKAEQIAVVGDGVYDFVCVLTEKGKNGEDIVLVDTLQPCYLLQFHGLIIPDAVEETDGNHKVVHHYEARGVEGKITITVTSSEI